MYKTLIKNLQHMFIYHMHVSYYLILKTFSNETLPSASSKLLMTASIIGIIIEVAAVLLIHIDRNHVVAIKPPINLNIYKPISYKFSCIKMLYRIKMHSIHITSPLIHFAFIIIQLTHLNPCHAELLKWHNPFLALSIIIFRNVKTKTCS